MNGIKQDDSDLFNFNTFGLLPVYNTRIPSISMLNIAAPST